MPEPNNPQVPNNTPDPNTQPPEFSGAYDPSQQPVQPPEYSGTYNPPQQPVQPTYQQPPAPYAPQPMYQPPVIMTPTPQGGKGLSIAALVLGIISWVTSCIFFVAGPCGIVGLILGIVSLVKQKPGRGLAIAGIILSAIGVIATIGWAIAEFSGALAGFNYGFNYGLNQPF